MSNPVSQNEAPLRGNLIADTSIRQPVFITMIMLLLVVLGGLAYSRMPVNLLPDFEIPVVVVSVAYPGAGPEVVADQVAKPIEDEVSTLSGVDRVVSTASEGYALVVVEFRNDVEASVALQDVRERVGAIRASLPEDIEAPSFQRFDPSQDPILTLAVTSRSGADPLALRALLDEQIVPAVEQAPGVGATTLTGGRERQIDVELDLARMQGLRVLPSQVSDAIAAANVNVGLGDAPSGGREVSLRAPSVFESPDDIAVVGIPGTPHTVGDVATVRDSQAEVTAISRLNGAEAITLDVRRQSGANTVAVAEAALAAFERAAERYPDLQYTVVRNDASAVRQNVLGAIEEIFIALGFAILVVMLFFSGLRRLLRTSVLPALVLLVGVGLLPSLGYEVSELYAIVIAVVLLVVQAAFTDRNSFITVIGLPVIILGTFAGIAAFGLTLNIITLLAISVSVGLVIDDAIVVRENIIHRLEMGDSPRQAASRGTAEVALSVLAMTLTIVAVFVPVTFTSGVTGIIFQSFGVTVAVAMVISLIEAFTFAPMLSAALIQAKTKDQGPTTKDERPTTDDGRRTADQGSAGADAALALGHSSLVPQAGWARFYSGLLAWSLRHRMITLGAGVAVIALTVVMARGLPTSFLPNAEEHRFGAAFELPAGTPLGETDRVAREFERALAQDPAVESVLTTVGGGGQLGGGNDARASFLVLLREDAATDEAIARLRPQLAAFPRLALMPSSYQFGTSTDVTDRPIQIQLRGGDPDALGAAAEQVMAAVRDVPGLTDLDSSYSHGAPELRYELDQQRANDYGLTNRDLALTMRALVDGQTAAVYREAGEDHDIVVRLRPEDRQDAAGLARISLPLGDELVPVSSVAAISADESPASIRRAERQTEVLVGASNSGRNINEVLGDVQARLAGVALPAGVTVSFGGASEDEAEGFAGLLLAMGLSVVFVYMVLASQFRSFSQPVVLMLAMPLSFIGAFLALRATGRELDILAMIGMLMLLGLVVKNSILLVDQTNQLRAQGLEKHEALVQAGASRLRPILMTSLTIVFGVLPAAVGFGYGAALRQGLATVVIGGIITSTLLTLLLVPTAYSLLDGLTSRLARLRQPRVPAERQPRAPEQPAPRVGRAEPAAE